MLIKMVISIINRGLCVFNLKFYLSLLVAWVSFISINSASLEPLMHQVSANIVYDANSSRARVFASVAGPKAEPKYAYFPFGTYDDPKTGGRFAIINPAHTVLFLPQDKPVLDGESFLASNLP